MKYKLLYSGHKWCFGHLMVPTHFPTFKKPCSHYTTQLTFNDCIRQQNTEVYCNLQTSNSKILTLTFLSQLLLLSSYLVYIYVMQIRDASVIQLQSVLIN